jgi:CheY-like chemotaxis protein
MKQPMLLPNASTVLIVEGDVLVRLNIAEYLRACGLKVIETSGVLEAKIVLQHRASVDILFADALLAGGNGGFALAKWCRRYRPRVRVVLTGSLSHKTEAAANLCQDPPFSPSMLLNRIQQILRGKRHSPLPNTPRAQIS